MQETYEEGRGLIRFGVLLASLYPWVKLQKKARMSPKTIAALERAGIAQRANPKHWYGLTTPVPIDSCLSIQVMDDAGKWEEVL
jgi:hypothetical protein